MSKVDAALRDRLLELGASEGTIKQLEISLWIDTANTSDEPIGVAADWMRSQHTVEDLERMIGAEMHPLTRVYTPAGPVNAADLVAEMRRRQRGGA